ncbi:MAG: AraC family transcriptional regulator [Nannocystaceae bacterium]|nr:AraC family transcriptional regulator [Nannocystaceae bacterium]
MRTLRQLRRLVVPRALGEGVMATALPRLWISCARSPVCAKRVEARMVTLAVILEGRKVVGFGDQELAYDPGNYLLITGERRYTATIEGASRDQPYYSLSLEFSPERVAEALLALTDAGVSFEEDEDDQPAVIARLDAPVLDALVRLVECLDDPISLKVLAPGTELELLVHLLRSPAGATLRQAAAVDDGRILRARVFLQNHVGRRVSVDDVARHVAMSTSHFAHRFREVVRVSPMQYLKHLRLERARLLMLGEGLGAAEAGVSVGYASPSHFTRDFKGHFGDPPATYLSRFR